MGALDRPHETGFGDGRQFEQDASAQKEWEFLRNRFLETIPPGLPLSSQDKT